MLWVFTILAALLMLGALLFTHRVIGVPTQMGRTLYSGVLSGLAFLIAAGTLIAALVMRQWLVIPVAMLPGVMAIVSDLITHWQRSRKK